MVKFFKGSHKGKKTLCGKKSLSVKHSYNNSVSLYRNNDERHPILTIGADGEYKISLFKLTVIILGFLSAAALLLLMLKKIAKRRRRKLLSEPLTDEFFAYPEEDDLPF